MKTYQIALTLACGLPLMACGAVTPAPSATQSQLETLAQKTTLAATDAACFYEQANVQGNSHCVKLPARGGKVKVAYVGDEFNDKFSSLKLRPGLYVMANWDRNFFGGYKNLYSNVADLSSVGGFSWATGLIPLNDAISSFVVGSGSGDIKDYCPAGS